MLNLNKENSLVLLECLIVNMLISESLITIHYSMYYLIVNILIITDKLTFVVAVLTRRWEALNRHMTA